MSGRDLQTGISTFIPCTRMMRHRVERASERAREQREKRKDEGREGVKRGGMEEGSKDKAEICTLLHTGKWRRGT